MSPVAIALALQVVQEAIANAPQLATDIKNLFSGAIPTPEQWAALRASVASESYGQFVPNSQLTPSETAQ